MERPCPRASGTTGKTSSIRLPAAYSGTCGPGTLVTTRLNSRRDSPRAARAPSACSVGGANPVSAIRLSAPTDCPCCAIPRIA